MEDAPSAFSFSFFLEKSHFFRQLLQSKAGTVCIIQRKLIVCSSFLLLLILIRNHFMTLNTENAEIWISIVSCSGILQKNCKDPVISHLQSLPSIWEVQIWGIC